MAVEYRRVILPSQTALTWLNNNTKLAAGEFGVESDTGKFKIGNGVSAWADLPYAGAGAGGSKGDKGDNGLPGQGVPEGGVAGDGLRKTGADDYATEWKPAVFSDVVQAGGGEVAQNVVLMTQAEYDGKYVTGTDTPDPNTIYHTYD